MHRRRAWLLGAVLLFVALQLVSVRISLAADEPITVDDQSLLNRTGLPVRVVVLSNDTPDTWLATTVRIVDPADLTAQLTDYIEPDQGIWTVNSDGSITFTPCTEQLVTDGICDAVLEGNPYPIDYVVQNDQGLSSNPSQVRIEFVDAPDLTPIVTAVPNVMHGMQDFYITVRISELYSINTSGLITVRIPKDTRWVLDGAYDPGLTILGAAQLNNGDWTYSDDATYHIFKSTTVIPAGGFSNFGFEAVWNAGATQGRYTITSQIGEHSGGENRIDNNVDAEKLDYFVQ